MAVAQHNGRTIAAVRRRENGLLGITVRVNGQFVWHYGPAASREQRTADGAIAQTRREIDAVDAYTDDVDDPRFAWFWYRVTDPRYKIARRKAGLDEG
jgi:hypothetical protein